MRAECECRLGRSLALPSAPSPILRITQGHLGHDLHRNRIPVDLSPLPVALVAEQGGAAAR